jgi:hypothetical protein
MRGRYKSDPNDEGILCEIACTLENHLKEWYGEPSCLVSELPEVRVFKSSYFLRYPIMVSENPKHILVKIRRHSSMHSIAEAISATELHSKMEKEYLLLDVIYKFFGSRSGGLNAVRPLLYIDRWHALVMEEYQSASLRQLFQRGKGVTRLADAAKKTGRWLYLYHHKMHTASFVQPEDDIMNAVKGFTGVLDTISRGRIDTRSILVSFEEALHHIEDVKVPVSQTHGDMTCDNVLYSADGKVCAIDVKGNIGPAYTDLGLILIHPETFFPQVFTLGFFFNNNLLRDYRKAILEGYFGTNLNEQLILNLYCALMLLDKWVRYEDNATRYRGMKKLISRLLSPIPKHYYRNRINTYLGASTPADCGQL